MGRRLATITFKEPALNAHCLAVKYFRYPWSG